MRLTNLIACSKDAELRGADCEITGITADSRKVQPGFLFAAIPGTAHDGRKFIEDAIKRGAVAVLVPLSRTAGEGADPGVKPGKAGEGSVATSPSPSQSFGLGPSLSRNAGEGITFVTTPDIRKTISAFAAQFYPRQPETITAVTGTSGKTSAAQFTRELWQALGYASASIGTLGLVTAKEARYGSLTTPDAITLHKLLDETAGSGVTHLALEASSHGLSMNRLDNVHLKAAAFTNLSHDHLDFHGTMEDYLAAKLRLFTDVLPEGGVAVLNADVPEYEAIAHHAKTRHQKIISYGKKGKEIRLIDSTPTLEGQVLKFEMFGRTEEVSFPIIGKFQAWNALCALGLAVGSGADEKRAAAALGKVSGVPGRLELVGRTKSGAAIFVDYAHKPNALENVLTAIRPHILVNKESKLGVVLGCGGNRDKGKRPMMGEIAGRLADWVIVTDDNPRHEDAATIRKEIIAGHKGSGLQEIGDRAKAIAAGIGQLTNSDVLIIAGKGHETGQIVGDDTLPFDDADVARRVLAS